ncbi:MAG: arylsulfatase [Phycisphaerae bacterium]|nr:arylsulfatase [Phycisphaerae bacterium]
MANKTHTRRDFLRLAGFAAAASLFGQGRSFAQAGRRPNVVFILADDLGYGDPGCYCGQAKVPTPAMDRLASQGIRFTDAHTPSAVCTPTRYGLLTGRYCWRSSLKRGVLGGYSKPLIETDRLTVASLFQRHGYATACVGKWHLGLDWATKTGGDANAETVDWDQPVAHGPQSLGFDYSYIIPASLDMDPYCWLENGRTVEAATSHTPGSKRRWDGGGGFWRAGPIAPSFDFYEVLPTITAKSIEFIRRQEARKPFFLYVPLTAPHTPWMPTQEFRGRSQVDWYGDFVAQVDDAIGRIVRTIDNAGLGNDTLVIFTSDNGSHWPIAQIEKFDYRANGPWRGQKSDIHEAGHRVPFICRWPGRIKPGTHSDQTICLTDLLATSAALLGESLPSGAGSDSYNILPAMLDPGLKNPIREATVHHSGNGLFAIRQGDWKLIEGLGSGGFTAPQAVKPEPGGAAGQLYNLRDDPGEQKNLWLDRPEVVERLSGLLERYRKQDHSRPI